MNNNNKKTTQLILIICALTLLSSLTLFSAIFLDLKTVIPNNKDQLEPDLERPKTSYAVDLTGFPIYIDDSDPNYNWSKTAEENDWCVWDGSYYYLENIMINNLGSLNNSIEIRNSNVDFLIKNCYFYNTSTWGDDDEANGIYLYDVNNGRINNNNCSECKTGIRIENSDNNSISSNFVSYNNYQGIMIKSSTYNRFYNNTVSYNRDGISLYSSNYNELEENIIFKNTLYSDDSGIYLGNSGYNNITENIISHQRYRAIRMYSSSLNNISHNSIFNNGLGIQAAFSSGSNIITGNYIYNHTGSEEWADPFEGDGIYCKSGDNNVIDNNEIHDNSGSGIHMQNIGGFNLTNNNLWLNNLEDIHLKETSNFKLAGNTMIQGLFMDISYSDLSGVDIDTTNTVNGKPIYFYFDQDNLDSGDFTNAGQIYLYYCDNPMLSNLNFPNVTTGITLSHCNDNTISFIDASYNSRWGVRLYQCFNNDLSRINVFNSNSGIELVNCFDNEFNDNSASYNIGNGFTLTNCSANNITGNLASYNQGNGLVASWVNNSYVFNNTANYNSETGIVIDCINHSIITENIVQNNLGGGLAIISTKDCLIYENEAEKNSILGIGLSEGLDTDFYNNTAKEIVGNGFFVALCESVDVYNNYAYKNSVGMLISECTDCDIKENTLNSNGGTNGVGLRVDKCEFINVFKNSINNNYIKMSQSHNNSLILNDITWGGFILDACNQNIILGNSIYRGTIGVDLKDSSYNQILNNTITSERCFRETGNCISNVFENNDCKEELAPFFFREIMSIIGIASVLGLNIPLYLKRRKKR